MIPKREPFSIFLAKASILVWVMIFWCSMVVKTPARLTARKGLRAPGQDTQRTLINGTLRKPPVTPHDDAGVPYNNSEELLDAVADTPGAMKTSRQKTWPNPLWNPIPAETSSSQSRRQDNDPDAQPASARTRNTCAQAGRSSSSLPPAQHHNKDTSSNRRSLSDPYPRSEKKGEREAHARGVPQGKGHISITPVAPKDSESRPLSRSWSWDGASRPGRSVFPIHASVAHSNEQGFPDRKSRVVSRTQGPGARQRKPVSRPTLISLLGYGALHPPKALSKPPDFSKLTSHIPRALPDGTLIKATPPPLKELESLLPPNEDPDYASWRKTDDSKREHWHMLGGRQYLHDGVNWGVWSGHWAWMTSEHGRWWIATERQPLLRYQKHWWWQDQGVWFLLHQGAPWAYRWFSEWKRDGLIHPTTDTRIIYSADALRATVLTPGQGADLFDLKTGRQLGHWNENELPKSMSQP